MKADVYYDDMGKDMRVEDIPEDMRISLRNITLHCLSMSLSRTTSCMEKYLCGEELTKEEIKSVRSASPRIANTMVPVTCGTSYRNKGVQKLLDAIVDYMPAPTDVPAIRV